MGGTPSTMIADRVCYTLDSTLDSVDRAEQIAGQIAGEAGFSEEQVYQISMAVREAVANAVLHGNRYDPTKQISLILERGAKELTIHVRDQGEGIDLSSVPDPLAPENLLKRSGRGIFLMRAFMDEVRVQSNPSGTEFILIKKVDRANADPKEKRK